MYFLEDLINQSYFPYLFALLLAIPFIALLRQYFYTMIDLKNKEIKLLSVKGNAENKSGAYERMTLFLERIKPSNLTNNFDKNLEKHEFLYLTLKMINEEYNYNASQQLYITKKTWLNLVECKNKVIELLQNTYDNLGQNANLEDFKTLLLINYLQNEDFINLTIDELKREVLLVT